MLDSNLIYGYGDGEFNPQDKVAPDTMWCRMGQSTSLPFSFRNECVRTAEIIAQQAADNGLRPVLLLSGGLDSEVVAMSFKEAGVDFHAVTFRYLHDLNHHEVRTAEAFAKQYGIRHELYDIDMLMWMQGEEAGELFRNSYCTHMEMIPHMKVMLDVAKQGGAPVLGNGEALLYRMPDRSWSYIEYEYDLAWYRFARHYGVKGAMGFYQHTPNMTFAMLNEPRMREVARGENKMANSLLPHTRPVKYAVYKDYWPELKSRPKYDGGELVRWKLKHQDRRFSVGRTVTYTDKWTTPIGPFFAALAPPGHCGVP